MRDGFDREELLARFDDQVRRRPPFAGAEPDERVTRVRTPSWRGVVWSDIDETVADRVIADEVGRFAGFGDWEWKLYSHDRPPDLGARLRAAGFVPEDTETMLVARIADLDLAGAPPEGIDLVEVVDEGGVAALLRVHGRAFDETDERFLDPDGAFASELLADIAADRARAVVAMAGDLPVCSGRIEFHPGTEFASLYGGGTVPEWRRRGAFRAVVAHRAAQAAERGFRYLQTDASDDSRPILERLGFVALDTTPPYVHR